MTSGKKCPTCNLINPFSALRCDCGYDFSTQTMQESYLPTTQVSAGFVLAPPGKRLLAFLIDNLISKVTLLLSFYLDSVYYGQDEHVFFSLWFLVFLLYFLFRDGFGGGLSYGKRIMGIRVVNASNGDPCTLLGSFARNFLLLLGGIMVFIEAPFLFSRKRRRLGDMMANTLVVKK